MTPSPCYVLDGDRRWPGKVLAWVHDDRGWHGVVRYTKRSPEGWPMGYEHAVPAALLTPAFMDALMDGRTDEEMDEKYADSGDPLRW